MLSNEYYTGDKILQKTYCKDFISKRTLINNGELTKYYVENSHEGIISKEDFNKVQEMMTARAVGNRSLNTVYLLTSNWPKKVLG